MLTVLTQIIELHPVEKERMSNFTAGDRRGPLR
jgi:hypothetical protein